LIVLSASLLLALAIGPAALAAGPDHQMVTGSDSDPDFCGTGKTVDVSFSGVFNGWPQKATGHGSNTWTNPLNGVSVIESWSGAGALEFVDDGDGAYTVISGRVGRPEQLRLANGPLLTQDVGRIVFYDHFDADDTYLGTDVVQNGPHPDADAGFELWCDVMVEALGL